MKQAKPIKGIKQRKIKLLDNNSVKTYREWSQKTENACLNTCKC